MRTIELQKKAESDLAEIFEYLAGEAGLSVAIHFEKSARESFSQLAAFPDVGAPLETKRPRIIGVRKWVVMNFRNILIFYLARTDNILIVRVMHSSQNWKRTIGISWKVL